MSNFLEFIEEDIAAKTTLITSLPVRTKTNKKNKNKKIDEIHAKYEEYEDQVKRYLEAKTKKILSKKESRKNEELIEKVKKLEELKMLLNPSNTYYEKLNFDNLFYELSNYTDFEFKSLNRILEDLLVIFEKVDIKLVSSDFKLTSYVHDYMKAFLKERSQEEKNFTKLNKVFEQIYWLNPEIVKHIELTFRKLVKDNAKKFDAYIKDKQTKSMQAEKIKTYQECIDKLKEASRELLLTQNETIWDIIDLAKSGEADVNSFFEESKNRTSAYTTLSIEALDMDDKQKLEKFYSSVEKLRTNVVELKNYMTFLPIVNNFKQEYIKELEQIGDKKRVNLHLKKIKEINKDIKKNERKLAKINNTIFKKDTILNDNKTNYEVKQLKIESNKLANLTYDLYIKEDNEFFTINVLSMLNKALTISELMNFYHSHSYYKKDVIKKLMDLETYSDLMKISDNFDAYAKETTNIVTKGALVFEDNNLKSTIVNKYRLENINVTEEDFEEGDIDLLLEKLDLLLRIKIIEESKIDVEQIWFVTETNKILKTQKTE